ncbi:phosphoribosylformylglycinamidine synthase subunit PurL [Paludisphaera rhizosphaerae]|uniref:phosphoribosylformylglycinamidine synthase subunit PurL n=1 Tax=Paludisphaera rhizosphaerae TaxID=2711216 RepID=UPI0013EBC3DB
MLWHLDIEPAPGQPDSTGLRIAQEAVESGLPGPWKVAASRGFLVEGGLSADDVSDAARRVLVDPVVEKFRVESCPAASGAVGDALIHVFPKPGVTDPEAESALALLRDLGYSVDGARSVRSYRIEGPADLLPRLIQRVLANDAVEQAVVGPMSLDHLGQGKPYQFALIVVPIREMDDAELLKTSKEGQLSLSLAEMKTIQAHFRDLGRDPTDCELETLAQTWSEHCSHKTLRGRIDFDGTPIPNLLKRTIFSATQELGLDWLVSVFSDNAGVVRFDDDFDVCFKVETHNHPSAIDPYGGSNTGIGGVIRDALGTGLGSKPICNTDVFCVAPPNLPPDQLPAGVLHPKRVLKGVVAGVRDYGNRMGIPTVNGALVVDPAYLGNPLVFCGTVGVIPRGKAFKSVEPGDRIVAIGGRTGRDGIHGATFSSVELTSESESVSGGSVQIGDAITEKMVLDVIVQARDRGLFRAITDCGAGGFSSAVGEMGAESGAVVDLENAPLKYQGLSYTEIWISEAQERMVLAVPPESWEEFRDLCSMEGVEATDLGEFVDSGRLTLRYHGQVVGDLSMDFLHEGRPDVVRSATYTPSPARPIETPPSGDFTADLLKILSHWDVCSKEWIVRQYDHEVQARTVVKPLVGEHERGPGDASVILPVLGSHRGLAVSCGINPRYGRLDAYAMAACVIDEAVRNCVAVGADPDRIALLDNFCWGNPERPETLGSLVRAAQACREMALAYKTPFISGKDSLYNEYSHEGESLAIPPTLLISAIGQIPDVHRCVTMDFKAPGNLIVLVGTTRAEFGGSLWAETCGLEGGSVPVVDPAAGLATFRAVHRAIARGLIRSCHDLSEGGLAVAVAESAFAGRIGASISLKDVPCDSAAGSDAAILFSETPSRFLVEVEPDLLSDFAGVLEGLPYARLGVTKAAEAGEAARLVIEGVAGERVVDASLDELEDAWRRPLDW